VTGDDDDGGTSAIITHIKKKKNIFRVTANISPNDKREVVND
jgi:hypothetical protein